MQNRKPHALSAADKKLLERLVKASGCAQAAALNLDVSPSTLSRWRTGGMGPPQYYREAWRRRVSDLVEFLEAQQ
jgi:hypothetical protein